MKKLFTIAGFCLIISGSARFIHFFLVKENSIVLLFSILGIIVGLLFIYTSHKIDKKLSELGEMLKLKNEVSMEEKTKKLEKETNNFKKENHGKFYNPKKLISIINDINRLYKMTGFYEYNNTLLQTVIKVLFIIMLILIIFGAIIGGIKIAIAVAFYLIILALILFLFIKLLLKIIPKTISLKSVKLEKDTIIFQLSNKTEETYNINDIDIKYRITVRFTGKVLVSNFHFLIIGENFEKWISSAAAHNINYQALVYFIHYLKNDELIKINTLDTDFLRC